MCLTAFNAAADQVYPIVTYTCDPKENILKIKNEVKWDEEGRAFKYDPANGTYNPWDWVTIVKVAEGGRLITPKPPLKLTCALGKYTYTIELEPKIFNRNPDGNCGNRISVIATIWRGGNMLLDHKEFEAFCHGNAPIVRGVRITGANGEMEIVTVPKHQFY